MRNIQVGSKVDLYVKQGVPYLEEIILYNGTTKVDLDDGVYELLIKKYANVDKVDIFQLTVDESLELRIPIEKINLMNAERYLYMVVSNIDDVITVAFDGQMLIERF